MWSHTDFKKVIEYSRVDKSDRKNPPFIPLYQKGETGGFEGFMLKYRDNLKYKARRLRSEMTDSEKPLKGLEMTAPFIFCMDTPNR